MWENWVEGRAEGHSEWPCNWDLKMIWDCVCVLQTGREMAAAPGPRCCGEMTSQEVRVEEKYGVSTE